MPRKERSFMKAEMFRRKRLVFLAAIVSLIAGCLQAQQGRYVVIDQDAIGPAGTDMNSILVFLQSPNVNVLGITVVTGDGWRNEEVAHTLRLLELVGRTDVPVVSGMDRPMVRTRSGQASGSRCTAKSSIRAPGRCRGLRIILTKCPICLKAIPQPKR